MSIIISSYNNEKWDGLPTYPSICGYATNFGTGGDTSYNTFQYVDVLPYFVVKTVQNVIIHLESLDPAISEYCKYACINI